LNVVITEISGAPVNPARRLLAASTQYTTAIAALAALVPVPPGWTMQIHNPSFASYHGPENWAQNRQLIVAQEPASRIFFLA
jgi:hypothetical protein